MLGKRIINTGAAEAACTTDTVQILGDTSCITYYKMSDATDESGSYDGTATNVNFNVAGKFGNAGEFNGSSSYIDTTYNFGTDSSYSISFWMKTSITSTRHFLYAVAPSNGADNGPGFGLGISASNTFEFYIANGSAYWQDTSISAASYTNGNWHNLILVVNGTSVKLYANGNTTPIANLTSSVSAGTLVSDDLSLGRFGSYPGLYFNGSIDQVRIFDRAITSSEATKLYDEVYCQPTIVPTDHFETVLYDGNNGTNPITEVGFKPDLVWLKARTDSRSHNLIDSVRGAGKFIFSSSTGGELTLSTFNSFDVDGFTVNGSDAYINNSSHDYVAWNWKAGGAAVSNTDGTITSQVSANTEAGFSIVKYSSGSSATGTVGHGLSKPPQIVIQKGLGVDNWFIANNLVSGTTNYEYLLFTTAAQSTSWTFWDGANSPTSTTFKNGWDGNREMINYCFHSVDGMSKVGSYAGTGASNYIVTGFRPAFVMIKRATGGNLNGWVISDNKRNAGINLFANTSGIEVDESAYGPASFTSNGFTIEQAGGNTNINGSTYIYLAFAEEVYDPKDLTRNASDPFGDGSEVAFYKFEDDATDSTGSYDGTFTTPSYATGYIDKAAVFNGSSSYINLPGVIDKDNDTDYTFSVWVNFNSTFTSGVNSLFGIDTNNPPFASYLYGHSDGIGISMERYYGTTQEYANNYNTAAKFNFSTNTWYHIAGVYDASASTGKIYVNGSLIGTHNLVVKATNRTIVNSVRLGANGSSAYFDGKIDQVRIFDRALDSGEVTQLYNE